MGEKAVAIPRQCGGMSQRVDDPRFLVLEQDGLESSLLRERGETFADDPRCPVRFTGRDEPADQDEQDQGPGQGE